MPYIQRHLAKPLLVIVLNLLLIFPLSHALEAKPRTANKTQQPVPIEKSSKYAAIIFDPVSGQILHGDRHNEERYPASLTKMMTLMLLFDALDNKQVSLNTKLHVSQNAVNAEPTKLGLRVNDKIRVEDAIQALIIKSANDVAIVVAEALGKSVSGFARMMNAKAKALHMDRTHFENPHGLPNNNQVSTARDLAILAKALYDEHSHYYHYFGRTQFQFRGVTYRNHNKLVGKMAEVDGLKTGYIRASGFNLAASAEKNGQRLIVVVLGGPTSQSRNNQVEKLIHAGFKQLSSTQFAAKETPPLPTTRPTQTDKQQLNNLIAQNLVKTHNQISKNETRLQKQWGIQVGTFRKHNQAKLAAENALKLIPQHWNHPQIAVLKTNSGKRPLYRSQLIGFNTLETAQHACKLVTSKGSDCLVLTVKMADTNNISLASQAP